MLFSSAAFVGLFLPIVLFVFYVSCRYLNRSSAKIWLIGASLFFYAWWYPPHTFIVLGSLVINYLVARTIVACREDNGRSYLRKRWLFAGVVFNISLLAVFKYLGGSIWHGQGFSDTFEIAIPLAISFITFQQIAFLVDLSKNRIKQFNAIDYALFILFFPQLVMGPIVHFRELVPQFNAGKFGKFFTENLGVGLAIFIVGLFKKAVLADSLAPLVDTVFSPVNYHDNLIDAWAGAIAFQFQIYFDFSGYADMAIGLGRMMGINLPINFDSPLRAVNRFDVWRRWHVSFSSFMRQYVFFPLCKWRTFRFKPVPALFITVMVSALWHGFGPTFLVWGLVQGLIMLTLHLYTRRRGVDYDSNVRVFWRVGSTFFVTCLIGVLFRAPDLVTAADMYRTMFGLGDVWVPPYIAYHLGVGNMVNIGSLVLDPGHIMILIIMSVIVWGLPNTRTFFADYWQALDQRSNRPKSTVRSIVPAADRLRFRLSVPWGIVFSILVLLIVTRFGQPARFIYYQF